MQNERIIYADLLRIVATFGVIVLHTAAAQFWNPVQSFNWAVCNIYDSLVRWTVPVFVMISGMFFLDPERDVPISKLYKKSIFRLVIALVVWGLFYQLTSDNSDIIHSRHLNFLPLWCLNIVNAIIKIPFGPVWYHLWFVYMLIGLYILTPLYRVFVKNAEQNDFVYLFFIFAIFGTIVPLISQTTEYFNTNFKIFFKITELINYSGYFFAGYFFSKYDISKKVTNVIYIGGILSLIFTIIGTYILSSIKGIGTEVLYGNLTPNTMLVAFAIFLLFKSQKDKQFSDKKQKIVSVLSSTTFGIYLIHAFLLQLFDNFGMSSSFINPILAIPIKAIVVFCVSFVIIYLLRKIPICKYFT